MVLDPTRKRKVEQLIHNAPTTMKSFYTPNGAGVMSQDSTVP